MYYCYILYSSKIDKYYIGYTSNIEGRLSRHNCSKRGFTATGKPWALKYYEKFDTKQAAMNRERELKSWKCRSTIEDLISA
jgi:putative endonuclease